MIDVEMLLHARFKHRRSKWPKGLAFLYQRVDAVTHVLAARIGQNRAPAKRAGTKFHSSLKPADDFAHGEPVYCGRKQIIFTSTIITKTYAGGLQQLVHRL